MNEPHGAPLVTRGTVLSGTGGVWRVLAADGATYECALRGRLKQGGLKLAVGDDVELEQAERGEGLAIGAIVPRRSKLARRTPGGGHGERIVVANVDQVVVVFALVTGRILQLATDSNLFTGIAVSLTYFMLINLLLGLANGGGG